jgi:Fe-S-cluster containining protein
MNLKQLKAFHFMLKQYDNICPQYCSQCACEVHENALLLPNEEMVISSHRELIKHFNRHKDGFYYLNVKNKCPFLSKINGLSKCEIYEERPLDCRIFPFYPHFNLDNDTYLLLKSKIDCPLTKDNLFQMEADVKRVVDAINYLVPASWKSMYNELNYEVLSLSIR